MKVRNHVYGRYSLYPPGSDLHWDFTWSSKSWDLHIFAAHKPCSKVCCGSPNAINICLSKQVVSHWTYIQNWQMEEGLPNPVGKASLPKLVSPITVFTRSSAGMISYCMVLVWLQANAIWQMATCLLTPLLYPSWQGYKYFRKNTWLWIKPQYLMR